MDRFTKEIGGNYICVPTDECVQEKVACGYECQRFIDILQRLGEYEATGRTPDGVIALEQCRMPINVWVRDKQSGRIHQVGTDPHDSLEVFDGAVHYVNMQCMCGTLGGDYEFVEAPDPCKYVGVMPEQLMLNKKMIHKDLMKVLSKAFSEELNNDNSEM